MKLLSCALACLAAAAPAAIAQAPQPKSNGANPVVSPDGKRILFSADRGGRGVYFIRGVDGAGETRISTGSSGGRPVWTADGRALLTTQIQGDTLRVLETPVDGGTSKAIATLSTKTPRAATVASDRSRIVIGAGDWTSMQLFSAPLDGSAPARQITPGGAAFWCHTVSPDAKRVAASRSDSTKQMQVWVMDVDGANARPVTRFTARDGSPQCPAWSSDGKRLAVQSSVPSAADPKQHVGNIWVVDLGSGAAAKLAPHDAPYLDELPSWFPDGTRIAFQSNRTGAWEIWVMNVDGSNARQLTR